MRAWMADRDPEADEDEEWIPNPDDRDYDLSEAADFVDPGAASRGFMPQWLIAAISLILIAAILTPVLLRLT